MGLVIEFLPMKNLVAIVGTTGVGKSNLGIKIARQLNGQIINADSMQVYKNLDIISNKPSKQDFESVEHHLFDFVENNREYSVAEYTSDATNIVNKLHSMNVLPVVVGGTNYYVQSLLFSDQLVATSELPGIANKALICHSSIDNELGKKLKFYLEQTEPTSNSFQQIEDFNSKNSLHELLKLIDPEMANRWHRNDVRKVRRSLEVYYTTGTKHSEHYKDREQHLNYRTCLLWLYSPPEILDPILDSRIDKMISRGMFQEMQDLLRMMEQGSVVGIDSAYTRGILQAIGFKEFKEYFDLLKSDASDDLVRKSRNEGIERMRIATRQYARKQVNWLKNKLSPMIMSQCSENAAIYLIDASGE